jgi:hypothetical protein
LHGLFKELDEENLKLKEKLAEVSKERDLLSQIVIDQRENLHDALQLRKVVGANAR